MNQKRRLSFRCLSIILAVMMILSALPFTAFAAPSSDIPEEMLENSIIRALEYTGYDVQTQKNNGTIYQSGYYSSSLANTAPGILSDISYGLSMSGKETTKDSATITGLAPDIAKFEQYGLCCASFVTYFICNYLPNIEGVDTSLISNAIKETGMNSQAVITWQNALNKLSDEGKIEKVGTNSSNVNYNQLVPGDIIIFGNSSNSHVHTAIYAGTYKGKHFIIHVGNERGPEISTVEAMGYASNGDKASYPNGFYHLPEEYFADDGAIEIYKKSDTGESLSGAVFLAVNMQTGKKYEIGPTDSNGYAKSKDKIPYGTYKITETVFPLNYQSSGKSEWIVTLDKNTPNATITIHAVNILIPGNVKITKASEDGKVEGIRFHISGNGVDKDVVSGKNGEILVENLRPGIYTVTEQTYDQYEPQETRRVTVVSGQTATVTFSNTLKRGDLTVTKTSEDGLTEGVKFHLSGTSLSGLPVDEYAVTDSSGTAHFEDVLIGSGYVLSEVDTGIQYVVPDDQTATVEWNKVTEKSFRNVLKKWSATITKSDGETGTAQGDASLAGAVYGVYKGDQLIDTYTTDSSGQFVTKYYTCGSDWSIREIQPSEGYLLDKTVYHVGAEPELYEVEYNSTALDVSETIRKGKIAVIKHHDDGSTQIETPEEGAAFEVYLKSAGSYENAKESERDLLVCDENGFAETKELPYGVYAVKQTKGWEGTELMPAFDVFVNEDGEVYRYLINNATFEALIEIVKKDAETGKVIPAAGIGFKVRNADTGEWITQHINYPTPMDIDTFYTDTTGKLMLPQTLQYGNYELVEQCTAYGYVLSKEPVPFKVDGTQTVVTVEKYNVAQKGTITVSKSGEIFSSVTESDGIYQPIYAVSGLAGAVYEIYAAQDIVTLDGTVRAKKGDLVSTIETDSSGTAESGLLYLGKYQIVEKISPYGMTLNPEPQFAELSYGGQEVEVAATSAAFYNERQRVQIELSKVLEQDETFGIGMNGEILSVQFALYAAEDLTAADGSVIPKDGLIEIVSCDENGKAVFITDIPVGSSLYVKEYSADEHYLISDKSYPVLFEYAGQDIETVYISINNGEAISNDLIRGSVMGKKVDEDGFAVGGAVFGLFKAGETEFTDETALMTAESNEIGVFLFEDVPYGNWLIRELKPAPAFVLNENVYPVTVSENEETVEITVENRFITGAVQTTKVDAEYPDNKLTGAVFEVYIDADGNQEFDPDIDRPVGEMNEIEDGVYRMDGLRYNGYFLYEKSSPEGFLKDENYHYFEIRNDGETVIVENEAGVGFVNQPITGELKITKKDISDGKLLPGVGFCIKNDKGEIVAEGYTDKNGIAEFTLRYGKYTYQEFDPLDGYQPDETEYPFEIKEDGEIIKAEMTNERIPTPDIPQTGDDTNLGFFIGLGAIALGGLVASVIMYIKRKKDDDDE